MVQVKDGYCVGRNGVFDIGGIAVESLCDSISFMLYSKAKGVCLNAGFTCDAEAAWGLLREIRKALGEHDAKQKR